MYCKDLKPPDKNTNNTEFLMEFNDYIDIKTPNNPMCEYLSMKRMFFRIISAPSARHFPSKASSLDLAVLSAHVGVIIRTDSPIYISKSCEARWYSL